MAAHVSVSVMSVTKTACTRTESHSFTASIHTPAHTHINNLCQLGLKQASSTSLAVIYCLPLLSHDSQRG